MLGTASGTVESFSLANGVCKLTCRGHAYPVTALDVCWSACGAFNWPVALSGSSAGECCAWGLMADEGVPPLVRLPGHSRAFTASVLFALAARAIAAGHGGMAVIWNVATAATPPVAAANLRCSVTHAANGFLRHWAASELGRPDSAQHMQATFQQ
jgi:hypothetical protein